MQLWQVFNIIDMSQWIQEVHDGELVTVASYNVAELVEEYGDVVLKWFDEYGVAYYQR